MMSPYGEPDNLVPKLHYQPCPAQPAQPDVKTGSAIFYFFSDHRVRGPVCRAGPNYAAQWKEKLLEFGEHLGNLHVLVPSPLCGYSGPGRALWSEFFLIVYLPNILVCSYFIVIPGNSKTKLILV